MKQFFSKKHIVRMAIVALAVTGVSTSVKAQSSLDVDLGADLVSGYVWRGVYQAGSGVSVQPSLGLSYKGLSLKAWGSTSLAEGFKELDLSLGYSVKGFSIGVTDYWWAGQGAPFYSDYMNTHLFEATVGYHFGEKFPLFVSWSTMFAGNLDKVDGERKYSSYVEIGYDFSVKTVDLTFSVGAALSCLKLSLITSCVAKNWSSIAFRYSSRGASFGVNSTWHLEWKPRLCCSSSVVYTVVTKESTLTRLTISFR